ncbi:MAG: hypothetical protein ACTTKO_09610 [Candidatus Limimorpha sp.]
MNVTQKDFDFMVEILTRDIIALLMERKGLDMGTAFDTFYNSDTYQTLLRPASGLYFQSAGYVYSFLDTELKTGKMG